MKRVSVIVLIMVLMLGIPKEIYADIFNVLKKGTVFTSREYPKDTNIAFELWNKANNTMLFVVSNATPPYYYDDNFMSQDAEVVKPGETYEASDAEVNPNKDILIRYYVDSNGRQGMPWGVYKISAPGKTKYLAYKESFPFLYPQTGSKIVGSKKTDTGFILKNNVVATDIQEISTADYVVFMERAIKAGIRSEYPGILSWIEPINYHAGLMRDILANNDMELLKKLINRKDFKIVSKDYYGNTVLHYAVIHNNPEAVKILLQSPTIDPNDQTFIAHLTPYALALLKKDVDAAKVVFKEAADKYGPRDVMMPNRYAWETIKKLYNFEPLTATQKEKNDQIVALLKEKTK